jgi:sulfur transfer complex TusBCD TusB component (DsrH family)
MTLVELKQILDTVGYPVAYSHFNEAKTPPFICYLVSNSSNFMADNKVWQKIDNIQIELYTAKKDLIAEGKLEQVLDDNEIPYDTTEIYIETEKLFQKIYEVSL